MKNLTELPRFADKLSYLYVQHAVVDRHEKAIAVHDADGKTPVPAASLGVLILGPGTKITHAAVKTLVDNNCQVLWVGEHAVRFYAHGLGGSRHSRNLIRQARLVSNELTRLQVVIRMYRMRFDEPVDETVTLQQLRGMEGARVRKAYAELAEIFGVEWKGRNYKRNQWDHADPLNRALSAANACLYGLCQAATLSAGYSPALGFIHTGKQLSFIYDVADLYKVNFTIPVAFETVAASRVDVEKRVRYACRDRFRQHKLIQRVLPDISHFLDVEQPPARDEFADDAARPAALWQPTSFSDTAPIGDILKFPATEQPRSKETDDDRHDRGTSDPLSAG
jgi:CRISPR-associated protein Cas1